MAGEVLPRERTRRIPLADPAAEALFRLRACTEIEAVEALGTPQELTLRLFGAQATKTLYAPLADALLRGLTRPSPTFSSIALASAAAHLLDPTRLVKVLSWDDNGFDIVSPADPSGLRMDVETVLGKYVDANRRLHLLESMWHDVIDRNLRFAAAEENVAAVYQLAAKRNGRAPSEIVDTFRNASRTMATHEAAAMLLEWHIQNFFAAHAGFVRFATRGRRAIYELHIDLSVPVSSVTKVEKRIAVAAEYLHAAECAAVAIEHLVPVLPGKRKRGVYSRKLDLTASDAVTLRSGALDLIRFAAQTPEDDEEFLLWNDELTVYRGYFAHVQRVPNEINVPSCPTPPTTLNDSAAQVAQLIRLGAAVPAKPREWRALVLDVCRPYYVLPAIAINSPSWTDDVDRKAVPGTNLTVRVPRDMTELSRWANFMGNCIVSVYGELVATGRSVILGLFDDDELLYNVGVRSDSLNVWEINSRFNSGNVPAEVTGGVNRLIAELRRTSNRPTGAGSSGRSTPSTATNDEADGQSGKRRTKSLSPSTWAKLDFIITDMRAYDIVGGAALRSLEWEMSSHRRATDDWVSSVTNLTRLDSSATTQTFLDLIEANGIPSAWPMLVEHPLDPVLNEIARGTLPPPVLRALTDIQAGEDRARLSPVLNNPVFEAAWQLARLQAGWRSALVSCAMSRPVGLRPLMRADPSGEIRRALGLAYVARTDEPGAAYDKVSALEWLDLGEGPQVAAAWRVARMFARESVNALAALAGLDPSTGTLDTPQLATMRAEHDLAPARVPRAWFSGRRA